MTGDLQVIMLVSFFLALLAMVTLLGIKLRNFLATECAIESQYYTFDRIISWLSLIAIMSAISSLFGNNLVANWKEDFAQIIPIVNLVVSILIASITSTLLGFKKWLRPLSIVIAVVFEVCIAALIVYSSLSILIT